MLINLTVVTACISNIELNISIYKFLCINYISIKQEKTVGEIEREIEVFFFFFNVEPGVT